MSKIKILQVIRPAAGGMKEHVLSIIKGIDKNVYEIVAACPEDSPIFQELTELGIKVYPVNIKGELSLKGDWQSIKSLKKIIIEEKIDLVHSHGSKAGLVARIAAKRAGVKNVFTVHGTIFHEHFSNTKKAVFAIVEKYLANITDKIITVSQSLKEDIIRLENVQDDKITVIYNGIPTQKFNIQLDKNEKRKELGLNTKGKVIVTVARLAPQKGLNYLLEAIKLIPQENRDLQLVIVGDGPLRKELEGQAKELCLTEYVKFLGHRKDVPEILAAADIFVLSSITEGLPLIVLEAMSANLPIVSTIVGGIPEIIRDGENGLLVQPKDILGLSKAMGSLLNNNKLALKLADNGNSMALKYFDLKLMLEKICDVYNSVYNKEK